MGKLIISFILLLFGIHMNLQAEKSTSYLDMIQKINVQTAKEVKKELGLVAIGTGGALMYDVKMSAMSFQYYHEIDIEKGRELIVKVIEKYLKNINENKPIRPYLHQYPFEVDSIEIRMFISKPDGRDIPDGQLEYISCLHGIIEYNANGPKWKTITLKSETFNEAVELLHAKHN